MIESFITQNMVERGETAIADYLRTGQSNYQKIIDESWADVMRDLVDRNLEIRRLCKRLSLQDSITKTAAFDGEICDRDYAQRLRLVLDVTAITGGGVFTLQGTDDDGDNYYEISTINDAGATGTMITVANGITGVTSYLVKHIYKQYRLQVISIGTTVTYSSYLVEEIYTSLHRDKTRSNIYRSLISDAGDDYNHKMELYENAYINLLNESKKPYDVDDDETIEEEEAGRVYTQVSLRP